MLKIAKLVFLIFMMYLLDFLQSTVPTCVFNFCPPKTDSDSWSSDNRSSTVLIEIISKHNILTRCGTVLGYRCMKFALFRSKDCLCRSPEHILQEAKETLCDSEKRSNYDKWRNSGISISYKQWLGMKEHVHQVLL
jgi:hypothetical protein